MDARCRFSLFSVLGVSLLLFYVEPALTQTTGQIAGRVADTSGAALPGVTLQATSPNLQGTRATTSGPDGGFRIPAVPPGEYRVRASLPGFRVVEKDAAVRLDAVATADFSLEPAATEQVVVSGETPVIDKTSTTTGTNYHATVIDKLPVDRNYADIVFSQPGVQADFGETQGRSLAISIYGSTSAENLWLIDGVNTTNVIKGVQGKDINTEFVQEVEVKTGGYQAEYGRNTGGVINVITKSGGNEFHGGAFGYYNDTGMRAFPVNGEPANYTTPDYSETGVAQAGNSILSKDVRQEWGMDLGGYFWKDRVWFFGAYDRAQINRNIQTLDPTSAGEATFGNEYPLSIVQNKYSGKLTLNLLQGTSVVGTFFSDAQTQLGALVTPFSDDPLTYAGRQDVGGPDYGARLNQLLGSFGIFTFQYAQHADRYATAPAGYGRPGIRDFTVSPDGSNFTTAIPPDNPAYPPGYGQVFGTTQNNQGNRRYYGGAFTAYLGNHEIKLGGDYQDDNTSGASYFTGQTALRVLPCLNATQDPGDTSYCDLSKAPLWLNINGDMVPAFFRHIFFATGTSDDFQIAPSFPFDVSTGRYGAFIQDQWRISPTLTANLGVRWDSETFHGLDPVTGPFEAFSLTNQWSPRVGIVWDFVGDGTSKLYASAGRFYYALPTDLNARLYTTNSFVETFNYEYDSLAQDPAAPRDQTFSSGSANSEPIDPGTKASYQDEFTIGVEKAFDPTFSVGLKGTYRTLGRTIEDRGDLYDPTTDGTMWVLFNPGGSGPAASGQIPVCNLSINPTDPTMGQCGLPGVAIGDAKRIFRGIEVTARKQFTNTLWSQLSFLYSSLRGNYSGAVSEIFGGQTDPGFNADFDYYQYIPNSYGDLDLDRPVQARLDAVYTASFGLSAGLGFYVRSGIPISRIGSFGPWPDGLFLDPRGSNGRTPTDYDLNLSASYALNVGSLTITPMVYLYNVLNHQTTISVDQLFNPGASFVTDPASPFYGQAGVEPGKDNCSATTTAPCTDNPDYRKATAWTNPRRLRIALKVTF